MPSHRYRIPGRFYPPSSLLGRWIQARIGDPLRGEAIYLFAAGAGAVALILIQFLGWGLWIASGDAPSLQTEIFFWGAQLVLTALYVGTVLVGYQSEYLVTVGDGRIRVEGDAATLTLPVSDVERTERISRRTYHRHYRKYRRTRKFVNRPGDTVLLLWTASRPVALGLETEDQRALCRILSERHARPSPEALRC